MRDSSSLRSGGEVKVDILILDAASSIRSIALSGRKRSLIYLDESVTALFIASSVILTVFN